jgi:hypothetical protein
MFWLVTTIWSDLPSSPPLHCPRQIVLINADLGDRKTVSFKRPALVSDLKTIVCHEGEVKTIGLLMEFGSATVCV